MTAGDVKKPCPGVHPDPDKRALMVQQLLADNADNPLELVQYFRHLVSCSSTPYLEVVIEEMVEKNWLPKIVGFLHNDSLEVQKEAAWVLGNVAREGDCHIRVIVEAGAVAPMVGLLSSTDLTVLNVDSQSLANIASLISGRDQALAHDVVTPLLTLLKRDEIPKGASMLLRNLCMGRDPPPSLSCLTPCLPTLTHLAFHSVPEVSDEACFALTSLNQMYGPHLSTTLGPNFLSKLLDHQRKNPERRGLKRLLSELTTVTRTSPSVLQADTINGLTKEAEQKKPPQGNSTPRATRHSLLGRRSRSPSNHSSLNGVSTRNKTKRMKTDHLTPIRISPAKPRTRASSQRFTGITPNRSESHIFQKKDEIFRAVEEGDLERVEHLVRHTGPGVTSGTRGNTLLHVAADNNQPHVVLFLLELISPNIVNNYGQTPAHLAAMKGHTEALRIMLSDPQLYPDKRDPSGHSYTYWLASHLFDAVLKEDVRRVRTLLGIGADADQEGEWTARGPLVRELQVTSARHLARALQHESVLRAFDSACRREGSPKEFTGSVPQNSTPLSQLPLGTLELPVDAPPAGISRKDVYKMDAIPRGYVCLLSYGSFKGRPDLHLEGSETDAHNLANVFGKMGYRGHAHFSLTAKQTRQQLASLRDNKMLEQASCAIFVISSHGASRRHFLTSDMQTIDTQWVLDSFKDSQCPSLKNKPKIFIWNLCRGHLKGESGRGDSKSEVYARVEEPLRDVMCLDANNGAFSWHSFSEDGTPFTGALCRTLARHAATKELTQLYRDFLLEYARVSADAVPQLTNHGFNKKFYFNPDIKNCVSEND